VIVTVMEMKMESNPHGGILDRTQIAQDIDREVIDSLARDSGAFRICDLCERHAIPEHMDVNVCLALGEVAFESSLRI